MPNRGEIEENQKMPKKIKGKTWDWPDWGSQIDQERVLLWEIESVWIGVHIESGAAAIEVEIKGLVAMEEWMNLNEKMRRGCKGISQ